MRRHRAGREPFSLLDHRDHLDLNHCLWLSETADLDRRAGRTGYPEVAHAHVGALGECLVVRDEGVGLNNIGPSRASGLEAGVEVLKAGTSFHRHTRSLAVPSWPTVIPAFVASRRRRLASTSNSLA